MTKSEMPSAPNMIPQLLAGVPPAYALLAGMQLDVFSALQNGPLSSDAIAKHLGLAEERLRRLLHALVLTGLLGCDGKRFFNSAEATQFLVKGRPGYIGGVHELLNELWSADLHTAESIRSGVPKALHDFANMSEVETIAFLTGLIPGALESGRDLARRFDFSRCRSVIDVGGGPGSTLVGLCEAYPNLRGTLFELPRVVRLARNLVEGSDYRDRIDFEAGDIVASAPRSQHDAAVMKALVQVLPPEQAVLAIRNTCASLVTGGAIYIIGGGILDDNLMSPTSAVFMDVTFLNLYRGGRAYPVSQYFAWLADSGCIEAQRTTLDSQLVLIWATKRD